MEKSDIIKYVQETPQNTNPAILMQMLDGIQTPAPSGTTTITSNGTYDVTNYAQASVTVPPATRSPKGYCTVTNTYSPLTGYAIDVYYIGASGATQQKRINANESFNVPIYDTAVYDGDYVLFGFIWLTIGAVNVTPTNAMVECAYTGNLLLHNFIVFKGLTEGNVGITLNKPEDAA